jgi:hypothetical protein
MNGLSTAQREDLLERARAVGWCEREGIVLRGSLSVSNETMWRSVLAYVTDAEVQLLEEHVRAAERARDDFATSQGAIDQGRAEREAPPSDDEDERFTELRNATLAAARDAARPATKGQLDELIALTRELIALTKR